jgi:hypothetical protein
MSELRPVFTHYGLFWSIDDVLWKGGSRKEAGLWGRERARLERRGRPTIAEQDNAFDYKNYIGLYCLYRNYQLIYVGEAGLGNNSTLFQRLGAHLSDHLADQWDQFSWFGRASPMEPQTAHLKAAFAQMEALLIAVINPGQNKQSGTFAGAKKVFQVPHDEAEGDIDTKVGRLMAKLELIEALLTPPPPAKPRGRPKKVLAGE